MRPALCLGLLFVLGSVGQAGAVPELTHEQLRTRLSLYSLDSAGIDALIAAEEQAIAAATEAHPDRRCEGAVVLTGRLPLARIAGLASRNNLEILEVRGHLSGADTAYPVAFVAPEIAPSSPVELLQGFEAELRDDLAFGSRIARDASDVELEHVWQELLRAEVEVDVILVETTLVDLARIREERDRVAGVVRVALESGATLPDPCAREQPRTQRQPPDPHPDPGPGPGPEVWTDAVPPAGSDSDVLPADALSSTETAQSTGPIVGGISPEAMGLRSDEIEAIGPGQLIPRPPESAANTRPPPATLGPHEERSRLDVRIPRAPDARVNPAVRERIQTARAVLDRLHSLASCSTWSTDWELPGLDISFRGFAADPFPSLILRTLRTFDIEIRVTEGVITASGQRGGASTIQ